MEATHHLVMASCKNLPKGYQIDQGLEAEVQEAPQSYYSATFEPEIANRYDGIFEEINEFNYLRSFIPDNDDSDYDIQQYIEYKTPPINAAYTDLLDLTTQEGNPPGTPAENIKPINNRQDEVVKLTHNLDPNIIHQHLTAQGLQHSINEVTEALVLCKYKLSGEHNVQFK